MVPHSECLEGRPLPTWLVSGLAPSNGSGSCHNDVSRNGTVPVMGLSVLEVALVMYGGQSAYFAQPSLSCVSVVAEAVVLCSGRSACFARPSPSCVVGP